MRSDNYRHVLLCTSTVAPHAGGVDWNRYWLPTTTPTGSRPPRRGRGLTVVPNSLFAYPRCCFLRFCFGCCRDISYHFVSFTWSIGTFSCHGIHGIDWCCFFTCFCCSVGGQLNRSYSARRVNHDYYDYDAEHYLFFLIICPTICLFAYYFNILCLNLLI